MSKVSALVSAYHAKEFLDARITNLFGQKNKANDLEIIIVCQEGSAEERIASNYSVKMIRTPDIPTIGAAWNLAIQAATGDYLTTANSDDKFHIGGLDAMAEVLDQQPEIGLVFSMVDQDDGKFIFPWRRLNRPTGEVQDMAEILKTRCIIGPMPLWRRVIHQDVGYFNEHMIVACDYDMWVKMARAGVRFYYYSESAGIYVNRANSLEHAHVELGRMESQEIREAMR